LFGHVCRIDDDRLVKTVMLGMVDGDRTRTASETVGHRHPAAVHLIMNITEWNEKTDNVVDGPSGL